MRATTDRRRRRSLLILAAAAAVMALAAMAKADDSVGREEEQWNKLFSKCCGKLMCVPKYFLPLRKKVSSFFLTKGANKVVGFHFDNCDIIFVN